MFERENETRDALVESMGEQEFMQYVRGCDAGLPCADCGEECEPGEVFCSGQCRAAFREVA